MSHLRPITTKSMESIIRLSRIVIIGLLLVLLASCSVLNTRSSSQDGPPRYRIDTSKIPDAVPKAEPLSAYGNPRSYVVYGHRYYVSHSAKGYSQVGYASWYGTKFRGRRTSSGEPYNMLAMTGASRTLPLPTYAQVTNLENGKTVIIKINDRGPFAAKSNRILDLTYAAATKLGFANRGTALVRVTAIDPYTWHKRPSYYAAAADHKIGRHPPKAYLQVAAFTSLANAQSLQQQLNKIMPHHIPTRIESNRTHTHHHIYRVQIGPIANYKQADYLQQLLSRHRLP